jgi:hypothetical protein
MYRLMQSAKFTVEHPTLGPMSSFRQSLIGQYRQIRTALLACEKANANGGKRYYVLNDQGQENYRGSWID